MGRNYVSTCRAAWKHEKTSNVNGSDGVDDLTLSSISQTLFVTMRGDASGSDMANRRIPLSQTVSGDVELAVVHVYLLAELQKLALKDLYSAEIDSSNTSPVVSIENILREQFRGLNKVWSDVVHLCLKIDTYLMPIRSLDVGVD